MAITHNIDSIIKKLNLIEKAYLPQAAEQALKSFGFESRKTLADAMRDKYQTATNYTLKSPRFEHRGSELRIYINDDQRQNQSAAQYLFPTDSSDGRRQKPIKPTTLAGFLQGKYGTNKIAVPVPGSRAGRQFIAKNGNLKGKKVQSLISQLTSPNPAGAERYFVLPERHGGLGPGIWRRYRIKNQVSLAFALVDQKPKVDTQIDFHGLLIKKAEEQLPALIEQKLRRLLR
ncbi:hypothetical protein SynRS9907_01350 [Synechococcus sp. RS9907]|uniref:hypothetical protein n=1 Tax=Synechococcus sp. RS9907 TaxID=221350 RepID=UPI00165DDEEC|nr:hypothetical protein [Synechococcus sp. RS9907]QNI82194.1 hypothetical protein SynRS9907_01350 [Synechococcus sp. RS9907]